MVGGLETSTGIDDLGHAPTTSAKKSWHGSHSRRVRAGVVSPVPKGKGTEYAASSILASPSQGPPYRRAERATLWRKSHKEERKIITGIDVEPHKGRDMIGH